MPDYASDFERISIAEGDTIRAAATKLAETRERLLICVDENGLLAGVLTDGDLRRAFINDLTADSLVSECLKRDPAFVSKQVSQADARKITSERLHVVPVVDEHHKVVGYYSYKQFPHTTNEVWSRQVCVVGLGYVGLTLAVSLASLGVRVFGFDVHKEMIADLKKKKSHFFEVGLVSHLNMVLDKTFFPVDDFNEVKADVFILAVGTPLDKDTGKPNLDSVRKAAHEVGSKLVKGNLVIMRSTLPIGCSRDVVLPVLEEASGLKAGDDFFLSFAPERTIEGRALPELRINPQIVGGFDETSSYLTRQLFSVLTPSVIDVESLEAAEMCKLMDNTFRDHSFSYINNMATLAERIGTDISKLVEAVNFGYPRNRIPRPSPGVGGPCLSKDPYILATTFEKHGLSTDLLMAARQVNEAGPGQVVEKTFRLLEQAGKPIKDCVISLVGLAFKGEPETSDLRDSTSLGVVEGLKGRVKLQGYDPVVEDDDLEALGLRPVTLENAFDGVDAVIVLNNHQSYLNWNLPKLLPSMNQPGVFIDTWHIFDPIEIKTFKGIVYGGLGND